MAANLERCPLDRYGGGTGATLTSSIYLVEGAGGFYVGCTTRDVEWRLRSHISEAKRGSMRPFHAFIREHGAEAFAVSVVAQARGFFQALQVEEELVRSLRASGARVLNGAFGRPPLLSRERREQLWVRHLLGEDPQDLSREYGLAVRTIKSDYGFKRIMSRTDRHRNRKLPARGLSAADVTYRVRVALNRYYGMPDLGSVSQ